MKTPHCHFHKPYSSHDICVNSVRLRAFSFLVVTFLAFFSTIAPAGALSPLAAPKGPVLLTITGAYIVANGHAKDGRPAVLFDRQTLEGLGMVSVSTATPWTEGVHTFEGPLLMSVMKAAGIENVGKAGGEVTAYALDSYKVAVPLADIANHGVILAMKLDGRDMRIRDKGPLWIIYPLDERPSLKKESILNRMIWQLEKLEVK